MDLVFSIAYMQMEGFTKVSTGVETNIDFPLLVSVVV